MRKVTLDIRNIETVGALHIYLQYKLDFPAYYGRNLDALYDLLTEMGEEVGIILLAEGVKGENAAYLPRLVCVMEDAAQENEKLHIEIR